MVDEDWMRERLFWAKYTTASDMPTLACELEGIVARAAALADRYLGPASTGSPRLSEMADRVSPTRSLLAGLPGRVKGPVGDELTVALMGRTTAGKSTIIDALTHADGSRQGRGAQRTTRRVSRSRSAEVPGVILVDTPGVGAHDGQEDWDTAFEQVPDADLILWVALNDSQQEETTRALNLLASQGKPIIVALNCGLDIDGGTGCLNEVGRMFLADPTIAFDEEGDHARIIRRHIAVAGMTEASVVSVHARAAWLATTGIEAAADLRRQSRIEDLIALLNEHASSTRQRLLRTLAEADRGREPLMTAQAEIGIAIATTRDMIERERQVSQDARRRMIRALDGAAQQLRNDIVKPIDQRRNWHNTVDPGKGVTDRWKDEAAELNKDLEARLQHGLAGFRRAVKGAATQTSRDWESVPMPTLTQTQLTGFGQVAMNRAVKLGVGLAGNWLAAGAAGAAWGAGVGSVAGPMGIAVGLAAGAVVSALAGLLAQKLGNLFKGEATVRKERQAQLGKAIIPKLDELTSSVIQECDRMAGLFRAEIKQHHQDVTAELAVATRVVDGWELAQHELGTAVAELDAATARALLVQAGRRRVAEHVVRAVRSPAALAVEMSEPAFSEMALFPVHTSPVPIIVAPRRSQPQAGQSLNLMAQLSPGRLTCIGVTRNAARFRVKGPAIADSFLDAWEALMSDFTESTITIESGPPTPQRNTAGPRPATQTLDDHDEQEKAAA